MQKVARVKGPRKRRGNGQAKSLKRTMAKKKSKFWIKRVHQIKIFHIYVPTLGEIYHFGHNIACSVKLRPIYGHGS